MAADFSWLHQGIPIFGFVLVFVLVYAIIAKTKILGESKAINAIISFILGIIFLSFSSVRQYVTTITPWFTVLIVLLFFFFLMIAFIIKEDITKFTKPLTIVFIILLAIVIIAVAFYNFPSTRAILPGNFDSCEYSYNYDYDYYEYEDCDKRDDYYKCYTDYHSYTYDVCVRDSGEYKCYDYESKYENRDCEYDENDLFVKLGNYIYSDEKKAIHTIWFIIIAAVVIFIVTRS